MESSSSNYSLKNSAIWKTTLEDGLVKFTDVVPMIGEISAEALKKKKDDSSKYDLSEGNIIKTLTQASQFTVITTKLYYYPTNDSVYKVLEVKKDADGKVNFVKMVHYKDNSEITLEKDSEISTLRDYVWVNVKIYTDNILSTIINTKVKLQNKLDAELGDPIQGATNSTISMFKLFMGSKLVDKESFLSSHDDVKDDLSILATTGFSKPRVFKRFRKPYEWPYWGYYGTTTDAIAFVPNQNCIIAGFTLYATDKPSFECKYKIYVDDNIVEEEDAFTCSEFEDKFYFRIKLKGFHEVKAGSKLEITVQIAQKFANNEYVSCYYGEGGDYWREVENEDMGLWEVVYSSKSGSSSIGYGNFPEIMYYV